MELIKIFGRLFVSKILVAKKTQNNYPTQTEIGKDRLMLLQINM